MTKGPGDGQSRPPSQSSDESYGAFAYAYDRALGDRFFKAARVMLTTVMDRYPGNGRRHLDVACGTGLASRFFIENGYQSTGIDLSIPMLRQARSRNRRLAASDIRALPFRTTFDRITCLYDSLNHFLSREELVAAFRGVAAAMGRESLFFFDMNHPDVYPDIWGMTEPYVSGGANYHLEIATRFRAKDGMAMALVTGWAILADGQKAKIREKHSQHCWTEAEIVSCLHDAGLRAREVLPFDPFHEGRVIKLFFVAELRQEQLSAGAG